jgi:hypothetical protein
VDRRAQYAKATCCALVGLAWGRGDVGTGGVSAPSLTSGGLPQWSLHGDLTAQPSAQAPLEVTNAIEVRADMCQWGRRSVFVFGWA